MRGRPGAEAVPVPTQDTPGPLLPRGYTESLTSCGHAFHSGKIVNF